jgi:hypothetical protein
VVLPPVPEPPPRAELPPELSSSSSVLIVKQAGVANVSAVTKSKQVFKECMI